MSDGFPRTSFFIGVVSAIGAALAAFENGFRRPSSLFFLACAAVLLIYVVLWGLSTSVVLLRDQVVVTFDEDGNAHILKEQTVLPLRRSVSGLDERVGSEGDIHIESLTLDSVPCQYVILALTKIQSRMRQVLRTDLAAFRRHKREVKIHMTRSFCAPREWYEVSPAYPTRLYSIKLVFPKSRVPKGRVDVYRRRGSADISVATLAVHAAVNGQDPYVEWAHSYLGVDVLYRFEWDWDAVGNGQNDGQGNITDSGTHRALGPTASFLVAKDKSTAGA